MIEIAKPAVDDVDDPNGPQSEKERALKYSLRNKTRWLRKNRAAFALFRSALRMKTMHPAIRDSGVRFPSYAILREMARAKSIERKTYEMRGDWNGAMQSRIDTIQMGNDMAHGGALIAGLVGLAIQAIGRNDPWSGVEHLNARQARAAAQRLETIYARRITYAENMGEEKWGALLQLQELFKSPTWRDISQLTDKKLSLAERAQALMIPKQTIVDNVVARYSAIIANARLPLLKHKILPPAADPFSRILIPVSDLLPKAYARNDAGNALLLTALALRAYKIEHKNYPATLRVLVPAYLKRIPADPFGGGESLRYKRAGSCYVLWSIGPDGIDNGGVAIQSTFKSKSGRMSRLPSVTFDSKGDYVAGRNR